MILKALIPEGDIAAMRAAGPPRRDFPFVSSEIGEIREMIVDGFDHALDALAHLFTGGNVGKLLVKVADRGQP